MLCVHTTMRRCSQISQISQTERHTADGPNVQSDTDRPTDATDHQTQPNLAILTHNP